VRASRDRNHHGVRHHVLGIDDCQRPSGRFHRDRCVDVSVVGVRLGPRPRGKEILIVGRRPTRGREAHPTVRTMCERASDATSMMSGPSPDRDFTESQS
jgi:hypothetical protein